jgi:hypothetical protein
MPRASLSVTTAMLRKVREQDCSYSAECVEGVFSELRTNGVLRSSSGSGPGSRSYRARATSGKPVHSSGLARRSEWLNQPRAAGLRRAVYPSRNERGVQGPCRCPRGAAEGLVPTPPQEGPRRVHGGRGDVGYSGGEQRSSVVSARPHWLGSPPLRVVLRHPPWRRAQGPGRGDHLRLPRRRTPALIRSWKSAAGPGTTPSRWRAAVLGRSR